MAIIFGTDNPEFLFGTDNGEDIRGLDGNDTIIGVGGNDSIFGNLGNDFVSGNQGNDQVFGGQGDDTVVGGQGNDTINGNLGNDLVNGNIGDDVVFGGQGNDTGRGGQGNDIISGDLGNDLLFGDVGNDTLIGGDGFDAFVLDSRDSRLAVITDFRANQDYLALDGELQPPGSNSGTPVTLVQDGNNTNILVGDRVIARLLDVVANTITNGNFTRTLVAPTTAPTSTLDTGNNITGTSGNDTIAATSTTGVTGNPANVASQLADTINGSNGDDLIQALGGNDSIQGGVGNDTVVGGAGNDTIVGGAGDDVVIWQEGDGSDSLDGGEGLDQLTLNLNTASDQIAIAAQGNQILVSRAEINPFSLNLTAIEQLFINGGSGNDLINASTSLASLALSLNGDPGNDTLIGGLSNDLLTGGDGGDLFVISRNAGSDTITDFVKGTDLIGLGGGLTFGNLTISAASSNITTITSGEQIIATLLGVTASSLTNSDFVPFTIPNPPAPGTGTFAFSGSSFSVNEDGTGTITLVRTGSSTGTASVLVTPTNGTATGGTSPLATPSDFDNSPITVTFAPGETSKTITIPILNDAIAEPNETVNLSLTAITSGITIGSPSTATLTIVDNDAIAAGSLSFSSGNFRISEDGVAINAVTITRSGDSSSSVAVTVNPSNGTATGGSTPLVSPTDFANSQITVIFAPGETSKTVTIPLLDDAIAEPDETISLTLSNPTGGAVLGSQSTATLTIADNDSTTVSILATDANASEANLDTGTYTFSRTGSVASALTVNYQVSGTASGADYVPLVGSVVNGTVITGSVVIPVGSSAVTLNLLPIDDEIPDGNLGASSETLTLTLTTGVGYNIGSGSNATVTIGDNDSTSSNDLLRGGDANDQFNGLAGSDTILGGAGNDTLIGGAGSDLLTGGSGSDLFLYTAPTELGDTVTDFVSGSDRFGFDILAFGFTGLSVGAIPADRFLQVTTYSDDLAPSATAAVLIYEAATKRLIFDNNGRTAGGISTVATLESGSVAIGDVLLVNV
ncbi:MAG: Calx-beta domain-containing protein [Pseudanabaenaceae cyanobacterium bins.68]|nr:Calx-beta domain-containing protein [Pseudanabaenaceae cyanobacterium bins.68]